jgi:hypothetical protein
MISGEELAAALGRLDPRDWEVLDLSLRRRVPDEALAKIFGAEPAEVARRRATAIENLADALGIQRGEDLGAVLKALLETETWEKAANGKDGWQAFADPAAASADPLPPPEPEPEQPTTPPREIGRPAREPREQKTSEAARLFRLTPAPDPLLEPLPVQEEAEKPAAEAPAEPEADEPAVPEAATAEAADAPDPPEPADAGDAADADAAAPAEAATEAATPDAAPADDAPSEDEAADDATPEPAEAEDAGGPPPVKPPEVEPAVAAGTAQPPVPAGSDEPAAVDAGSEQPAVAAGSEPSAAPAAAAVAEAAPQAPTGNGSAPEPVLDMLADRKQEERRERFRTPALWGLLGGLGVAALVGAGWLGATEFGKGSKGSSGSGGDTRRFQPSEGGPLAAPFPSDPRTTSCYSTAYVRKPVQLYSSPGGHRELKLPATTEWGSPRVLSVVRRRGNWLGVLAPELKNGQMGWMDIAGASRLDCVRWSLHVDLSRRRLYVRKDGHTQRQFTVAIGGPGHPTPQGRFAVTDKLKVTDTGSPYGCCVLALTGHQNKLPPDWPGGDRLAVHATTDESSIGKAVSLGCMRAKPANVRWLISTIPLGTPIFIRS